MPAWDGFYEMIDMIKPGNFDLKELQPFYAKIFERYQAASKDNIMYFEPGQFPDMEGFGS